MRRRRYGRRAGRRGGRRSFRGRRRRTYSPKLRIGFRM